MSEVDMKKAKEVFKTIVSMLDSRGWKYEKIEDELIIRSTVTGEDLPIEFIIKVQPKNELVSFLSQMPFVMAEDKLIDGALATCAANYNLIDGSFDYDLSSGNIIFRLTTSYRSSTLSEDVFEYMVMVSSLTIDEYNDKFLMLSKGVIDLQKFIELTNN